METLKTTETHLIAESEAAAHRLRIEMPRTRLDNVVLKPAALKNLLAFMDNSETVRQARQTLRVDDTIDYGRSTLILMHGPAGTGKTMTARAMANRTGRPLVTFLPGSGRRGDAGFDDRLDAFLTLLESKHAIGLIDECHGFLGEDDDELPVFLTEIEKHDVTLFLTTTTPEVLGPALDRRISFKFATTPPDAEQRRRIWENLMPESVRLSADVDLNTLAGMFNINGGYIKNAILYALNIAILRDPDHVELTMSDLVKAARIQEKSTGSGMRIRTVLDPDLRPADICHDSIERATAETIALRLCRTTVDNANILVCCRDLARADAVALAIAGCSGGTISRIDTNMVLDGDMMYRRYDTATVLRQALGAAYESAQVMIVTGLGSHLPQTGETMSCHEAMLVAIILDHPGRKILVLDAPGKFLRMFPNCVLECLELEPSNPAGRREQWRRMLADAGWPDPGNALEKLAAFPFDQPAMRMVLRRAQWVACGDAPCSGDAPGHDGTTGVLLEAARSIAGLSCDDAPLFG